VTAAKAYACASSEQLGLSKAYPQKQPFSPPSRRVDWSGISNPARERHLPKSVFLPEPIIQ